MANVLSSPCQLDTPVSGPALASISASDSMSISASIKCEYQVYQREHPEATDGFRSARDALTIP